MTLWNPTYRIKINDVTVTSATLAGLTITSGRTDIYAQPQAGYCSLSLLNTTTTTVAYEINDSLTVEVQNASGVYVYLFGGFITDVGIEVSTAGATAISQRVNITAVGALARLARAVYNGNIASDKDGNQIAAILQTVLFDMWSEVPAALTWATYDPTTTWANAANTGLGTIDTGNYELHGRASSRTDVYSLVSALASSALGLS